MTIEGEHGPELDLEPPTFTLEPVPGRPGVVRPVLNKPLIPWLAQGLGVQCRCSCHNCCVPLDACCDDCEEEHPQDDTDG